MKKILFGLLLVILSPMLIKAIALSGVTVAGDTNVKIGENISLNLVATGEISLSADTFAFFLEYSDDVFEFVSYEGMDGTEYIQTEKKLTSNKYTGYETVNEGDVIGVLTLKVKPTITEEGTSTIRYYNAYESIFGEGSMDINYTLDTDNIDTEPTEDEVKTTENDDINYTSLKNPYFITTILATSATLVFSLATIVLLVKNKKLKNS